MHCINCLYVSIVLILQCYENFVDTYILSTKVNPAIYCIVRINNLQSTVYRYSHILKMPDVSLLSDGSSAEQYNLDSGHEKPVDKFADEIVGVFWKATKAVKRSLIPYHTPVDQNIQVSTENTGS